MKIVLFLIAVVVLLWLLKSGSSRRVPRQASRGPAPVATQAMLACAQCGVHLPRDEVLPGRGGVFCSEAHRAAFENGRAEAP